MIFNEQKQLDYLHNFFRDSMKNENDLQDFSKRRFTGFCPEIVDKLNLEFVNIIDSRIYYEDNLLNL
jgi:hypothetical protein